MENFFFLGLQKKEEHRIEQDVQFIIFVFSQWILIFYFILLKKIKKMEKLEREDKGSNIS